MKKALSVFLIGGLVIGIIIKGHAAPVIYSFTTGSNPFGDPVLLQHFVASDSVSGTFTYDNEYNMITGTTHTGSTGYAEAARNFIGSVNGMNFSDPFGNVIVGDEVYPSPAFEYPVDDFQIRTGLATNDEFSGFNLGGFTLYRVRLFWFSGWFDAPDNFLDNQDLPATPPSFHGRLALDFHHAGTDTIFYVFFDDLSVQAISGPQEDLDNDGILNEVDEEPQIISTRFSDFFLGGNTSGRVAGLDTGITVEIMDASNANDGCKVVVSGPADGEAKIRIDGSTGIYKLSLGEYILTSGSVTLQSINGIARVEFMIGGKMIVVSVVGEGTAFIEEVIIADELKELFIQNFEGDVTVDGEVLPLNHSVTVISVLIDIKPGSDLNCFNSDGHGAIPVAILGTTDFDATQVDPTTVYLDGQGVRTVGKGNTQAHIEDANGDGLLDLLMQIEDVDGTYAAGDTLATLTGKTFDGVSIVGTDELCIVP